jgi:toxin ParE1/3/4
MAHRVADEVAAELDEIWYYVAKQSGSVEVAERVIESLTDSFVMLGRNPRLGRIRDDLGRGLRSFPVSNYVIVYCIEDEHALILFVLHSSRDIEALFRH